MIGERTMEGWQVRLRTRGGLRYLGAGFLMFWLCGWAVGETFAIRFLIKGAIALLTGRPPGAGLEPLTTGAALMVGGFLLLWLTLWTVGGIAAFAELLRLLWGEDRIVVTGGRLTVTWSRGLFRRARAFERDAIRRIFLLPPNDRLVLESGARRVDLSGLGTRSERTEAAAALRAELALPESATAGQKLPDRWEEVVTPEGERALVSNLAVRGKQARVVAVLAMGAAGVTFLVARNVLHEPGLVAPAAVALVVTGLLAWGALWLARGRMEWRVGHGRLTLRKRYGSSVRDVFEAKRLVLDSISDSDGDVSYALYAVGDAGDAAPKKVPAWRPAQPKNSRVVARVTNDTPAVRDLAAWLVHETSLPLEDRTTPETRAIEVAQLKEVLRSSGRFGLWAAKCLDRLAERRPE